MHIFNILLGFGLALIAMAEGNNALGMIGVSYALQAILLRKTTHERDMLKNVLEKRIMDLLEEEIRLIVKENDDERDN